MARRASVDINEQANFVIIEGQKVLRPVFIAPSQWIEFWEKVKSQA